MSRRICLRGLRYFDRVLTVYSAARRVLGVLSSDAWGGTGVGREVETDVADSHHQPEKRVARQSQQDAARAWLISGTKLLKKHPK